MHLANHVVVANLRETSPLELRIRGVNATDLASSESPLGFGVGCRMGDDARASPQSYRESTEAWRRLRVLNARTPLSYVAPKVGCNAPGTDPDPVDKVDSLSDVNGDDPATYQPLGMDNGVPESASRRDGTWP
ncbi:hypothetical protein CPLU01_06591 [Colletotrichum plurivorum]|uniref:Uncharacterized protein n=1 Tax=Colletotrichum plurivorum TaxID=2175906 RepID=A0A8H6NGI5_9PEZI|nr:hypothetical protein CPLU01_06591 [Colletotrichum plurivorum]